MSIMIRAGQIWKENDPRLERYVRIESVPASPIRATDSVLIRRVKEDGSHYKGAADRWAKIARFNGKRSGYSLHRDAK
jgi:hypothetical protein